MSHRCLASLGALAAVIVMVSLVPIPVAGQAPTAAAKTAAKTWTPPRTPWGDPDLQGLYTNKADNNTPFERPKAFGTRAFLTEEEYLKREEYTRNTTTGTVDDPKERGKETERDLLRGETSWHEKGAPSRRTSLVVDPPDGRIPPMTPEGKKRAKAPTFDLSDPQAADVVVEATGKADVITDSWLNLHLWSRCITRGLPGAMLPGAYGHYYQIRQIPGYVVIQYEMVHETRTIPLDGRPHLSPVIRPYMGDSRGHWEGNTLVVDVTNFPANADFRGSGQNLHLVERFTRVDPDTVNWEVTVEDPTTWTRPWKLTTDLSSKEDVAYGYQDRIFQYECHEGNYTMINFLSSARNVEKQKAADDAAKKKER